jgi:hypothetical protein
MTHILRLCSECKKTIFFASTANGRRMPINSSPASRADADCYLDVVDGTEIVVVMTKAERDHPRDSVARTLYRTHWQDCSTPSKHRRSR